MDYKNLYIHINNYLIDKDIIINENDNFNNKLKFFLLKYKRIIAISLLIILLIIGYQCDLYFLNFDNNNNNDETYKPQPNILHGGYDANFSGYQSKVIAPGAKKAWAATKKGATAAVKGLKPKNLYKFGAARAQDVKEMAPQFYGLIYSIAISALMFLIFMPAIGFLIVGIVCYSLLKDKISDIKGL